MTARSTHVVVLPGLGLRAYLDPLLATFAGRGVRATLLDLPGFGRRGRPVCAPDVTAVGAAAADRVRALPTEDDVVLLGHSTGAQSALRAALDLQVDRPPVRLVLAGPTVAPTQRSLARLAAVAPLAYRHDSPREAVILPDLLRGHVRVLAYLRSGIADRPEDAVTRLRVPLVLLAGRADAFAPRPWLEALADASGAPAVVRVLPGSHNNPFTHPRHVAAAVLA